MSSVIILDVFAGFIVFPLFITGIAGMIESQWVGVLSGFLSSVAPFLFVIQETYAHLVSVMVFYPLYYVSLGILFSLLTLSIYLVLYVFVYQY
ncbi:hypothetical protein [uncultured Shewanella sp.]|uniref:hypothetical protein n=1 Tax=uncultured Shewanella sp. TaxID=173975 RepID=UPI0026398A38|nr:hypothetical protein [uncultured Shewanella sp.]